MKDKLEWNDNAMEQMKYISIIESIYLPDLEEYKYKVNVARVAASKEAVEEARNIPFGVTDCMAIFRERYNNGLFTENCLTINTQVTVTYNPSYITLDLIQKSSGFSSCLFTTIAKACSIKVRP